MRLMWIALLTLSAALPLPACAQAPVILVLGDSLSAAYGIALQDGWVALLQGRLNERGLDFRVVNAGISGDTTMGGLTRLPELLQRHRPAILLIELGANDGLRGLPTPLIRDNLAAMVRLGQAAGSQVLLLGIQMPPNYGAAYNRVFQVVFQDVARGAGVPLVPFLLAGVAEDPDLMQADGLHPAAAAQPRILDNVWPVLEPQLATAKPPRD